MKDLEILETPHWKLVKRALAGDLRHELTSDQAWEVRLLADGFGDLGEALDCACPRSQIVEQFWSFDNLLYSTPAAILAMAKKIHDFGVCLDPDDVSCGVCDPGASAHDPVETAVGDPCDVCGIARNIHSKYQRGYPHRWQKRREPCGYCGQSRYLHNVPMIGHPWVPR